MTRANLFPALVAPLTLLAGASMAQEPATKSAPASPRVCAAPPAGTPAGDAWRRFQAASGGTWWSQWSPATGTPMAILGSGLPLADWRGDTLEEARRHAGRLLAEQSELLGLGTSEFRECIGARMGQTWALVYEQWFRGLQVVGGRADVRVHRVGRVPMFGATAFPIPADFDTRPRLDELEASRIAWQQVGFELAHNPQPVPLQQPRLVIWGDVTSPVTSPFELAWEVRVSNVDPSGRGPIGRYYVDARTGAVLHYTNDKHECGGEGGEGKAGPGGEPPAPSAPPPVNYSGSVSYWLRSGYTGSSPITQRPAAGMRIDVTGVGAFYADANGDFSIDLPQGTPCYAMFSTGGVHNLNTIGSYHPASLRLLQPGTNLPVLLVNSTAPAEAIAHTSVHYWIHRTNEFVRSILGDTPQLDHTDQIQPYVNVQHTCNAYYVANSVSFYDAGGGCNNAAFSTVISHEWGHGLDDAYGGISNNTYDGLSEAWGDIVAMYLSDQPNVMELLHTNNSEMRSGFNSVTYPPSQSEVHIAGQSFMGFAWILREFLAIALANRASAASITNDIVLGSIVADATNQPAAVMQVFLADDDDGNMANLTPHAHAIAWACEQKGLPLPFTPPSNNDCTTPIWILNGTNGPFSNGQALDTGAGWACATGNTKDLWFRYLAAPGFLTVSTCGLANFDTVIEVYSGTCGNMTRIGCNDDACANQTSVTVQTGAGVYLIRVGGYNGASGTFQLSVSGAAGSNSAVTTFGAGCTLVSKAAYERFAAASSFDLSNRSMRLTPNGNHYVATNGPAFVTPPSRATRLALGDDASVTLTLPSSFSYPGGSTTALEVCSNGFVSAGPGNGSSYAPTVGSWLASAAPRWGTWHDFNPAAALGGAVTYHVANNIAYITWDGVYGFQNTSPSTWQLQFHLSTGVVDYVWQTMSPLGGATLVGYAPTGPNLDAGSLDLSVEILRSFQTGFANIAPLQASCDSAHLGTTATFTLQPFPPGGLVGALVQSFTSYPSGVSLAGIGMPGCNQYVSSSISMLMFPNGNGVATYPMVLPNVGAFVGAFLHTQGFALAPGVNAMGAVAANGVTQQLGS